MIRNEIFKAFKLKKIYLFMVIILMIEISTVLQYKLRGPDFIFITPNGQSLPFALLNGIPQLMIVFIAVFIAEIIADDYKNGTLKLSLLKPVDRIQLLNSKIISLGVFIVTILGFIVVSSYLVGTAAFGWGNQTIINGVVYSTRQGVLLTLQSAMISLLPTLGFGMLVLFIAVMTTSMGATIGISLGLMMVSPFIDHIEVIKNYSIIYQMYSFHSNFINHFMWENILADILSIGGYITLFYLGSMVVFRRKDILF